MTHILTLAEAEAAVREAAKAMPTPNVLRAVALAEAGTISWFDVYRIFQEAATKAIESVTR